MKLAQPHSDQLALVPTIVKLTEEKAVDLRSEQNQRALLGRQMAADKATYQKSPYPKQPPTTERTGYLSHAGDYLAADPKRKRSLRTSPTPNRLQTLQCDTIGHAVWADVLSQNGYGCLNSSFDVAKQHKQHKEQ